MHRLQVVQDHHELLAGHCCAAVCVTEVVLHTCPQDTVKMLIVILRVLGHVHTGYTHKHVNVTHLRMGAHTHAHTHIHVNNLFTHTPSKAHANTHHNHYH